jgi:hypothetical protein
VNTSFNVKCVDIVTNFSHSLFIQNPKERKSHSRFQPLRVHYTCVFDVQLDWMCRKPFAAFECRLDVQKYMRPITLDAYWMCILDVQIGCADKMFKFDVHLYSLNHLNLSVNFTAHVRSIERKRT